MAQHADDDTGEERDRTTSARNGYSATLTDGSRSVVLAGPTRTSTESTTTAGGRTSAWVRLLPAPSTGAVDSAWLAAALADRSPDVLATAMAYVTGAPTVRDDAGALLSSDASYGPLVDGSRQEGSDWNDYLQGDGDVRREDRLAGDGTGSLPGLLGLRADGLRPPSRPSHGADAGRRAVAAPRGADAHGRTGTLVVDGTTRPSDLSALLAGDLVLFDASTGDGTLVDHVGIYLGKDTAGHPRFVSSRKTVDGPTMGDTGGRSTLSGTGLYAKSLRAVRRLRPPRPSASSRCPSGTASTAVARSSRAACPGAS